MYTLIRITFKNGKPTHNKKVVVLSTIQHALLAGKGEGGSVLIRKEHLKYADGENTEDNKQDAPRSISTE